MIIVQYSLVSDSFIFYFLIKKNNWFGKQYAKLIIINFKKTMKNNMVSEN